MADQTSSDARRQRKDARAARRSLATEPFEQLDAAARSEDGDEGRGRAALKQAATTAALGALAAGIGGAARALMDRRTDESPGDGDGAATDEQRDESPEPDETQSESPEASVDERADADEPDEAESDDEQETVDAEDDRVQASEPGATDDEPEDEDQADDEPSEQPQQGASAGDAKDVVGQARQQLEELLGSEVESVSGFERSDGQWTVTLEVVDVHRIPESTDVLSSYEVALDDDRNLVSVSQIRRYRRSQVEEGH